MSTEQSSLEQSSHPTAASVLADHDLSGRTVVVTGATTGMGLASVLALAAAGARVGLLGRNPESLATALARTTEVATGEAPFAVELDLASLEQVRRAASEVLALAPEVDVLMNNAGVMFTPFGRTTDGFETQFGTCHLGHFLLSELLAPALLAAARARGEARLVVLASAGHAMADLDLADPNWEDREYDKFAAYGGAKTANVLHAVEWERRYGDRGVHAYAVHPGTVATELSRHMGREDFSTMFNYAKDRTPGASDRESTKARSYIATPEEGASTQVWACVAPELSGQGGAYLADRAVSTKVRSYARDADRAQQLWTLSERLVGLA